MKENKVVVITSINLPTEGVRRIAEILPDWKIIVVADKKTPIEWSCGDVKYFSVKEQVSFASAFAKACPYNHYARKNIGYIKAISEGAEIIAETDDDNIPYKNFLQSLNKKVSGGFVQSKGWNNVYKYFSDKRIWPRGFPLEYINESFIKDELLEKKDNLECPIQQSLADNNPDVDAIFRLTTDKEIKFSSNTIILSEGSFCPFNSQNTVWWPEAYPLLYLPSYVSFRMTDIWRSFIAQICLFKSGKYISFSEPTMYQIRNEHSLIKDFRDEVPGYLNNVIIMQELASIKLSSNPEKIDLNLRLCYERLVAMELVPKEELILLDLWLKDLKTMN